MVIHLLTVPHKTRALHLSMDYFIGKMRNHGKRLLAQAIVVLVSTFALHTVALALPEVPEEEGWRGYAAFGFGYTELESNTIVGNKFADFGQSSLGPNGVNQQPPSTDDTHLAIAGEVTLTLADRNQLFLGTSVEDKVSLDGGVQLGWRKQADSGIYQLSLLASTFPREVWEDPYNNNTARQETDRKSSGARFQWDRILGSAFEVQLSTRKIEIDTEAIGTRGTLLGLSPQDIESLARDGDEGKVTVAYRFRFGENRNHLLRPLIGATSFDADGDAQGFDATRFQLTYSYFSAKWIFVTNVSAGQGDYDNINPVYLIKQDWDSRVVDASVFYRLPYDGGRWQVIGNVLWGEVDSDIDFHDIETTKVAVLLQYRFGALPQK